MAKIVSICPVCNKTGITETSLKLFGKTAFHKLDCGHTYTSKVIEKSTLNQIKLDDGRSLYPFQVEGVRFIESSSFRALITDEMGLGKGSIASEPILTPTGWTNYGSIQVGDKVIGSDGLDHTVTGVYPRGVIPTYKVEFSDGSSTIVDKDHLWAVNTPIRKWRNQPDKIKSTSELIDDLTLTAPNSTGKTNSKWYIPITKPIHFLPQDTPIDAYALGLLLGDGGFTQNNIRYTSEDLELVQELDSRVEDSVSSDDNQNFHFKGTATREYLKDLGLYGKYSNNKFIPSIYLFNDLKTRLAILQGLMDTDGSIGNNGVIEFCSTSEQLVDDVKFIVQSLGGVAYKSDRITSYSYKGEKKQGQKSYRLILNIPINPFKLARKAIKFKGNEKYKPTRAITNITLHSLTELVICIAVDAKDRLYLTKDCIVTHNTIQAVAALKLHSEELLPALVIVKASLTVQWAKEIYNGTGLISQILDTKSEPLPGMPIYITSFDSLPGRNTKNGISNGVAGKVKDLKIKTLIVDECQMMKNHDSNRTNAIRDLLRTTVTVKNTPISRADYSKKLLRAEMIAKNLMEYHGIKDRFSLTFDKANPKILGYCECKSLKENEGRITGRINLSAHFIESTENDEQLIEIILHEIAHAITPGAGHRDIWRDTAIAIGSDGNRVYDWCNGTIEPLPEERQEPSIKYIIALSGTPIKNNAIEYFPILNLLHPERFPNRQRFIDREVAYYNTGGTSWKPGGLRYPDQFQEKTKDFIIRRTRKEVLPDLPKIQRDYKLFSMGEAVKIAYNKKVKQLSDFLDESEQGGVKSFELQSGILGYLNMLRHITGLAKVEPVIEYIDEFLSSENGSGEKITVFHHHIDVGEILKIKLDELFPDSTIRIVSQDDASTRGEKIEQFRTDSSKRILIAPTLACGEGINLQFCSHSIIMEREWNPANEEQAEGRFSRIGSNAERILVNYPTGTGTIDEFLTEMVERKRQYVSEALDGSSPKWEESDIIRELASKVVAKWRLQ